LIALADEQRRVGVFAVIDEIRLEAKADRPLIAPDAGDLGAGLRLQKVRNRNGRQNGDNRDDDQQFDQG